MLDLTKIYKEKFYEIKLIDGTELKLKRPTQAMVEYTLTLKDNKDDDKETLHAISGMFVRVLNRNTEDRVFTREEVDEEYDTQIIAYVIQDYFDFWQRDVNEKVDFQ